MTKDELERIKQAYSSGLKVQIWFNGHWENFDIRDYSMFPEPFSEHRLYRVVGSDYADIAEKRIADLEKENEELKEKLKTAYRKGMRHIAKALKDYDRTDGVWTDYFEHTVDKVLQREQLDFEEYGTLAEQLTKAKALLKQFLYAKNGEDTYKAEWKAEHFLKESEE